MNETSVIDFYRLIDTIDINQIRFADFSIYRLINRSIPTFIDRLLQVLKNSGEVARNEGGSPSEENSKSPLSTPISPPFTINLRNFTISLTARGNS